MPDKVVDSTAAGGLTIRPTQRLTTFTHAAFFVLGFSTIFILGWGGAATLVGDMFFAYRPLLARIGGVVVILFGLATIGILRLPWIQYDLRPQWNPARRPGCFLSCRRAGCRWSLPISVTWAAMPSEPRHLPGSKRKNDAHVSTLGHRFWNLSPAAQPQPVPRRAANAHRSPHGRHVRWLP